MEAVVCKRARPRVRRAGRTELSALQMLLLSVGTLLSSSATAAGSLPLTNAKNTLICGWHALLCESTLFFCAKFICTVVDTMFCLIVLFECLAYTPYTVPGITNLMLVTSILVFPGDYSLIKLKSDTA